jgi:hypothetical protein
MKARFARALVVSIAAVFLCSGETALAGVSTQATGPAAPVGVKWKVGKPSPFAGTRFDGQFVVQNQRVYFLGFRQADDSTSGEVWYYDVLTKTYVDTGTVMPVPVSNYTIAPLDDANGYGLYIFGGRDASPAVVTTVQVYYPATNTARVVTSDPWPGTTPSGCVSLPATGVAVVNNLAYVMGGIGFTSIGCVADENSSQVWRFDPTAPAGKKWQQGPDLNVARGYITAAVLQGTGQRHRDAIYAIGGDINDAGSLTPQTVVEKYKIGWTAWKNRLTADLPEACDESQAFAFDTGPLANTITLAGCGQWPNALPDVLQYDRRADSWSIIGALNEARRNQAGASIGTADSPKLYLLGGYAGDGASVLQSSEVGTVATGDVVPGHPGAARRGGTSRAVTS